MLYYYCIHADAHGLKCLARFLLRGLMELIALPRAPPPPPPRLTASPAGGMESLVSRMPSVREFRPMWFARGPVLQTLLMALHPLAREGPRPYRRELVAAEDSVELALDWCDESDGATAAPVVLCLHGLGGSGKSPVMRAFTRAAAARGFRACVYNRRGHGGTSLLPSRPGVRAATVFPRYVDLRDMQCVVDHVRSRYPDAPLFLMGFSCGANLAASYLAAASRTSSPFLGCSLISNPYDIRRSGDRLDPVANGMVCQFLKDVLYEGALKDARALAEERGLSVDFGSVLSSRTIQELDSRLLLPACGYSSLDEYYRKDSSIDLLDEIAVPTICIDNRNDPLIHPDILQTPVDAVGRNPNIMSVVTEHGGHGGWIEDMKSVPWAMRVALDFFQTLITPSTGIS